MLLSFERVRAAIEPARWALLTHAVTAGGFAASDTQRLLRETIGLELRVNNARAHAQTLQDAGLLDRDPEASKVYYRVNAIGAHVYRHLVDAEGATPPHLDVGARLIAVVARAGPRELEILEAATEGEADLVNELRRQLSGPGWRTRRILQVEER